MTQDYFETVSMPEWQPLILAMCFLHSLVQVLLLFLVFNNLNRIIPEF